MHLMESISTGHAQLDKPEIVQLGEYAVSVTKIPDEETHQESVLHLSDPLNAGKDSAIVLKQNFYVTHSLGLGKRHADYGTEGEIQRLLFLLCYAE
jgi:hypothetical protein